MTGPAQAQIEAATDQLYALLPAHVRSIDAANGWALKALCEILAGGGVEIDREIDALYDAMFVETAPDGALDDLAALVASEPLRPLPPGSGHNARAFIANTVRYRRGKGTARVLESLAADVGGFGSVAVEYFMRLARVQSLIDVRTERPGTAMLIPGETSAGTATARDAMPRLVDIRSIARARGRHHVPHVGVHILRPVTPIFAAPPGTTPSAADLAGVPVARAWPDGGTAHVGYFQLSAHPGRVLRLFNPDRRSQDERPRVATTDLADRLRRLPLHLETRERRAAVLGGRLPALVDPPWFDDAGQPFAIFLRGVGAATFTRVAPSEVQIANLDSYPMPAGNRPVRDATHPIRCGFDPVTGRLIVAKPATPEIEEVRIAYATGIGREIGAGPQERNTADVPFDIVDTDNLVHFVRLVDATAPETGAANSPLRPVRTLAKALAEWSASGAGKRGLIVLLRCDREEAAGGTMQVVAHPASELHIVAAQWRPRIDLPGVANHLDRLGYVVRRDRRFTIDGAVRIVAGAAPPPGGRAGVVVIDGIEVTGGVSLAVRSVSRLWLRHATVRAPGTTAVATTAAIEGAEIAIDRSIVGRVTLDFGTAPATGRLAVSDSIVSTDEASGAAITARSLDGSLRNVTVLGTSSFKRLDATNVIFTGATTVTRSQSGCVRYSAVADGSTLPRRFRCQPDLAQAAAATRKGVPLTMDEAATVALGVTPLFLDTALDEPTVAMLHPMTADAIRMGGEGGAEMGVFAIAAEGLRRANLTSLFDDYVPAGLEAAIIDDTRSGAVATRRNRP